MRSIPAGRFKAQCLKLLDEVAETGETIVVTKRGKPAGSVDTRWMDAAPTAPTSPARSEFDVYAKKTPAEKMHEAMLKKLGITEEEYKAMSAEQRAAVDAKIKEMVKAEIEDQMRKGKTGIFADVTA